MAAVVCGLLLSAARLACAQSVVLITAETRAERQLPDFYQKSYDANGILILGSEQVSDEAIVEAGYLMSNMLSGASKVRQALADAQLRVTVMAPSEFTTDVPEHSKLTPKRYWDRRARGLGGTNDVPVCSCGEENLLEYPGDPYRGENILIHEFSHSVHLVGMARVDSTFDARLRQAFERAKSRKLWEGTYAATNHEEYFAEGSQSWFGCNAPPGKVHGDVRTRDAVREYDPDLAALLTEVYGDNDWQYTPPSERASRASAIGHDASRTFAWPASLLDVDVTAPVE